MRPKLITIGITVIALFGFLGDSVAQDAKITIESWSPQEIHDMHWTGRPSTGLSVVGRGDLVYLFGTEAGGEDVSSFAWSIMTAPAGSVVTLDSMDTQRTTFSPDSTGQYEIKLSIMTATGMAETTVIITSALYVGVGGVGGLGTDVVAGQCAICHSTNTTGWNTTGHSTMLQNQISGFGSSHYNGDCIGCHTAGWDSTANNGGFRDVADQLGWTFPDSLHPDVWDDMVVNFPQLAHLANIQCESCHGPGSLHKGNKATIEISLDAGMCAKCHDEEPYHRRPAQWKASAHAVGVGFAAGRAGCADCHSGYGFIARIDQETDKGPLEKTTGFPQVSCAVCHDPHSITNPLQLRTVADVTLNNDEALMFGGNGRMCMSCHLSRRNAETYVQDFHSHFGPHHSNQSDMLAGTNAITFGKEIPSGSHKNSLENLCVDCHMAPTPGTGQPGRDRIGDHSFAMHDPVDDVDNVSACAPCHFITSFDDFEADFDYDSDGTFETLRAEIQGLLDDVGVLLPPVGDPAVVVDTTQFPLETYTPMVLQAAYNHLFVTDDGSMGMHNFAYAANLLAVTRDTLRNAPVSVEPILDPLAGLPGTFALHQNYPNPFNPTTKVRFDVPQKSHVRLIVYNSIGQEVETLVDEELAPNSYEVDFNAFDLPSGLYFYRVEADNFLSVKKMLLLK